MEETAESVALWLPIYCLLKLLVVFPFFKILARIGLPSWIAIFAAMPLVPIVFLWLLAFSRWPGHPQSDDVEKLPPAPGPHMGRYI